MPTASLQVSITVRAAPAEVFAYTADLTRHGEWASDPVHIELESAAPAAPGSRYRSTAQSHGMTFTSTLEVTRYEPPVLFEFRGADATSKFRHTFTFKAVPGGTLLTRRMEMGLTPAQWLAFYVLLLPVRLPSARRSLKRLKQALEARTGG